MTNVLHHQLISRRLPPAAKGERDNDIRIEEDRKEI